MNELTIARLPSSGNHGERPLFAGVLRSSSPPPLWRQLKHPADGRSSLSHEVFETGESPRRKRSLTIRGVRHAVLRALSGLRR